MGNRGSSASSGSGAASPNGSANTAPAFLSTESAVIGVLQERLQARVEGLIAAAAESHSIDVLGEEGLLDLSRNGIKEFPKRIFEAKFRIRKLHAPFNRLQKIPLDVVKLEGSLEEIDVMYNHIMEVDIPIELVSLTKLNVSRNGLASIAFLAKLPNLKTLDVSANPICQSKTSMKDISQLSHLVSLNISNCILEDLQPFPMSNSLRAEVFLCDCNMVRYLPDEIGLLTELRVFSMQHNPLQEIPKSLWNLTKMTHLDLQSTQFSTLPEGISKLQDLVHLNFAFNKMKSFPEEITAIPSIHELLICGLEIQEIPISIKNMKGLRSLILRWNRLSPVPDVLYTLTQLETLDLCGNEIAEISNQISNLKNLTCLNLSQNKMELLPPELSKLAGLRALGLDGNTFLTQEKLNTVYEQSSAVEFLNYFFGSNNPVPAPQPCSIPVTISAKKEAASNPVTRSTGSKLTRDQLRNKIYGLVFGMALGDAIGLSTEFLQKYQASLYYGVADIRFDKFLKDKHRNRWVPGDFTDDTDQGILLLRNVLDNNGNVNVQELSKGLYRWAYEGFAELGDKGGMGIGDTVGAVLRHKDFIEDPHKASTEVWVQRNKNAASNGAIMRTSVLGAPFFDDIKKVVDNTRKACRVTHVDPRCEASCIIVTACIALMLQGQDNQSSEDLIQQAYKVALEEIQVPEEHKEQLDFHVNNKSLRALKLDEIKFIGYTMKALGAGLWALRQRDFHRAIMRISLEAGDADTNGAVCGSLLGCKLGFSALPVEWVETLVHKDWLSQRAEELCQLVGLE